ncbi:MAG TPA: helix-turn-helix transcriptional regulator [Ktedonosporobacter sp.]|nr:helix-turn-helix transcriptional regulator [Ktedonosporobacter sp.]
MTESHVRQVEPKHEGRLIAQYREAAGLSQQKLAEYMQVSVHTVQRMEKEVKIKDLYRRRLLVALLGIPVAYLRLDQEEQKGEEKWLLLLNDDPMSFVEDMVANRWKTHLMGGPLSAAHGLGRMVKEVEGFTQNAQGKEWHQRANVQLCMAYQLQASVVGDMMRYDQALKTYKQAFAVARELNDVELQASIRVREAVVFMRKDEPLTAITHLDDGLDLITGQGFPHLRGNMLALLSEAYAKAQRPQECWRNIGLAERVLEQDGSLKERSHRAFNPAWVVAHKGVDALLLNDYDRALKLIDKSLKMYNPTLTPGRARLLARKAEAYYGLNEIDDCTAVAEEALMLSYSVGASNTITRVKSLHATLAQSRWGREPGVARLGAVIATSKGG